MLGTLPEKSKSTWREQVPTLVHAYNCIRNNVMTFSPYYLMFGHKLCLPIVLFILKTLRKEWPGCIKLQMKLLRRNRIGTNNVMTARSDA